MMKVYHAEQQSLFMAAIDLEADVFVCYDDPEKVF